MSKGKNKLNEVKIYRSYIKAKGTKGSTIVKLCEKLGVPRQTLYSIVKRIEGGNKTQLNRCLSSSKYDCLWRCIYQQRFFIIDEEHGKDYPNQIKALVKDMHKEGFGVREISRRIGRDPSTVMHHLKIK